MAYLMRQFQPALAGIELSCLRAARRRPLKIISAHCYASGRRIFALRTVNRLVVLGLLRRTGNGVELTDSGHDYLRLQDAKDFGAEIDRIAQAQSQ